MGGLKGTPIPLNGLLCVQHPVKWVASPGHQSGLKHNGWAEGDTNPTQWPFMCTPLLTIIVDGSELTPLVLYYEPDGE